MRGSRTFRPIGPAPALPLLLPLHPAAERILRYVELIICLISALRLNRPDLHNAFNEDVIGEITRVFRSIASDVGAAVAATPVADASPSLVRAVVLTGNGPSFSAGADLSWMKKMATYSEEQNKQYARRQASPFPSAPSSLLPPPAVHPTPPIIYLPSIPASNPQGF